MGSRGLSHLLRNRKTRIPHSYIRSDSGSHPVYLSKYIFYFSLSPEQHQVHLLALRPLCPIIGARSQCPRAPLVIQGARLTLTQTIQIVRTISSHYLQSVSSAAHEA